MEQISFGNLAYLLLLLVMVLIWTIGSGRINLGQTLRYGAIWALIFLGAIAVVGMWEDIRSTVKPTQVVLADEGRVEIPRSNDGHYYAILSVNGAEVLFVVDTGATDVVLTQADAHRAGLDPENLPYFGRAMTANGEVRIAPVRLDEVALGGHVDRNVRASVNEGEMSQSLLGMTYLQLFDQITITGSKLILTR
ncbi:TIGR02281 family clan AA aspartic protease [uncultured Shimia sp.]|uniref:retropepsin-like aspartic protease family protein n=1 Tax=uncultured Shimia sp. TaxID=573152 RepID=UPI002617C60E|nr:TIGR02281 family clan AA aspartic protease [uncultured Shimia sp.]